MINKRLILSSLVFIAGLAQASQQRPNTIGINFSSVYINSELHSNDTKYSTPYSTPRPTSESIAAKQALDQENQKAPQKMATRASIQSSVNIPKFK